MGKVPVDKSVLNMFKHRLHPDAWDILEAWVEDAWSFAARVRRKRDGKQYIAKLNMIGGELNLIPERWARG